MIVTNMVVKFIKGKKIPDKPRRYVMYNKKKTFTMANEFKEDDPLLDIVGDDDVCYVLVNIDTPSYKKGRVAGAKSVNVMSKTYKRSW